MTNLTQKMITLAKSAQSAEELLAMAKENGIQITEENAKAFYERFQGAEALSDSDLQAVAGGAYEELMKPIIFGSMCGRCNRPYSSCTCG